MAPVWKTHLGDAVPYDRQYHDNTRVEIASFINEPPAHVLDVGCGAGATGKLIKEKFPGVRVIGIESNPHAADRARAFLDDVICGDLYEIPLSTHLGNARVDLVLLLDVLEHRARPARAGGARTRRRWRRRAERAHGRQVAVGRSVAAWLGPAAQWAGSSMSANKAATSAAEPARIA